MRKDKEFPTTVHFLAGWQFFGHKGCYGTSSAWTNQKFKIDQMYTLDLTATQFWVA